MPIASAAARMGRFVFSVVKVTGLPLSSILKAISERSALQKPLFRFSGMVPTPAISVSPYRNEHGMAKLMISFSSIIASGFPIV